MIRSIVLAVLVAVLSVAPAAASDGEKESERQVYIFSSGGSWLGVNVGDVDEDRAAELGLDDAAGAEIQSVVPDSPNVQVFSGGSTRMVQVKVAKREHKWNVHHEGDPYIEHFEIPEMPEMPEMPDIHIPHIEIPEINIPGLLTTRGLSTSSLLGVVVDNLNEQLGDFFGVEDGEGVLVRSVMKGSRAEDAGIKAGDVIIEIDDVAISDSSDLRMALRERRGESLEVTVVRDRRQQRLSVAAPEKDERGESESGEYIWYGDEGVSQRAAFEEAKRATLEVHRAMRDARVDVERVRREVFDERRRASEEIRRAVEEARRLRQESQRIGATPEGSL
jgi:hypothetical protein